MLPDRGFNLFLIFLFLGTDILSFQIYLPLGWYQGYLKKNTIMNLLWDRPTDLTTWPTDSIRHTNDRPSDRPIENPTDRPTDQGTDGKDRPREGTTVLTDRVFWAFNEILVPTDRPTVSTVPTEGVNFDRPYRSGDRQSGGTSELSFLPTVLIDRPIDRFWPFVQSTDWYRP